jgi:hypothetical protein
MAGSSTGFFEPRLLLHRVSLIERIPEARFGERFRGEQMSLRSWLKSCSGLLASGNRRRGFERHFQRRAGGPAGRSRSIRRLTEGLEERVLPATFVWEGSVTEATTSWSAIGEGFSNWSVGGLPGSDVPASGDQLVFDGSPAGELQNDLAPGLNFTMEFTAGDYVITGESIRLANEGSDIMPDFRRKSARHSAGIQRFQC